MGDVFPTVRRTDPGARAAAWLGRHASCAGRTATGLFLALVAMAGTAQADVLAARYAEPTTRYAHGVLGDAIEYGALEMDGAAGMVTVRLPDSRVFEDIAPRLIDIDGDGTREVLAVESAQEAGARIVIYAADGTERAATPHIGQRFRWYAPVGAADLDGDGHVEVAFVDRPHLAKTLRIWRYADGDFTEVASLPGVTNHRIGETDIAGGLRDCGQGPQMVLASADWGQLLAVAFDGGFTVMPLGAVTTRAAFAAALACED